MERMNIKDPRLTKRKREETTKFDGSRAPREEYDGYVVEDRAMQYGTIKKLFDDADQGQPHFLCTYFMRGQEVEAPGEEHLHMRVVKQIGGESSFGQVFKVEFPGLEGAFLAAKLMPEQGFGSKENSMHELDTASRAKELVIRGESSYFPVMYGFKECNVMRLSPPSTEGGKDRSQWLFVRAQEWAIKKDLIERFSPEDTRQSMLRKADKLDVYTVAANIYKDVFLLPQGDIDAQVLVDMAMPIDGMIMFAELAWGDLLNLIMALFEQRTHGTSLSVPEGVLGLYSHETILFNVILDAFNGIRDMHVLMNMNHNDLHVKNVLIQFVRDGSAAEPVVPIALIGDFGNARPMSPGDNLEDMEHFVRSLLSFKFRLPATVGKRLETLLGLITSSEHGLPPDASRYIRTHEEATLWWTEQFSSLHRFGSRTAKKSRTEHAFTLGGRGGGRSSARKWL